MPSTAMPSASCSRTSATLGVARGRGPWRERVPPGSAAARGTAAPTARAGATSRLRWSATLNQRTSSTVSPQNSTRTGCSSVGGKTSRMPPRTANSPRRSTRSTRMYAAAARASTTSSRGASSPGTQARPARGRRGRGPAAGGRTGPVRRRPAADLPPGPWRRGAPGVEGPPGGGPRCPPAAKAVRAAGFPRTGSRRPHRGRGSSAGRGGVLGLTSGRGDDQQRPPCAGRRVRGQQGGEDGPQSLGGDDLEVGTAPGLPDGRWSAAS